MLPKSLSNVAKGMGLDKMENLRCYPCCNVCSRCSWPGTLQAGALIHLGAVAVL